MLELSFHWPMIVKLIVAALLGALIGYEREAVEKQAGLRTHMLVCLASVTLTVVSFQLFADTALARVIEGIITGMGFIGAGAIISEKSKVKGLTTAASLWFTAIIGIVIALEMYAIAITGSLLALIILELWRLEK